MSLALCIDLGGTNIRAGLCAEDAPGDVTSIGRWPAPAGLEAFADQIGELVHTHGVRQIGIAAPGLALGTTCIWMPNLPYLDNIDLTTLFPHVKIAIGNDAQLALLAEITAGSARDLSNVILLAIGTGIGSAVLSDGRIVRGHNGAAASFGWACANTKDAGDERSGWLERQASGRALDRLAQDTARANGAGLIAAARSGDATALEVMKFPATSIGTTLAGAVALLGCEAVIFSGGVACGFDVLAPMIQPVLHRQLPPHLRSIRLVKGELGPEASLAGAGIAAHGSIFWETISQ